MTKSISISLREFADLLEKLSDAQYSKAMPSLSGASIGGHTRHIIELYQSLLNGYEEGIIDYDNRKRDKLIETSKEVAVLVLNTLAMQINRKNKDLFLSSAITGYNEPIRTNYFRELLYNFEHCIHHHALIRIALKELNIENLVNENFGVAPSTVEYRHNVHS